MPSKRETLETKRLNTYMVKLSKDTYTIPKFLRKPLTFSTYHVSDYIIENGIEGDVAWDTMQYKRLTDAKNYFKDLVKRLKKEEQRKRLRN